MYAWIDTNSEGWNKYTFPYRYRRESYRSHYLFELTLSTSFDFSNESNFDVTLLFLIGQIAKQYQINQNLFDPWIFEFMNFEYLLNIWVFLTSFWRIKLWSVFCFKLENCLSNHILNTNFYAKQWWINIEFLQFLDLWISEISNTIWFLTLFWFEL